VRARVTTDAGEAVLQHAAREKLVGDLRDDGTPRAVLAREALVRRTVLGPVLRGDSVDV
jgi:hypothetical protein